MNVLPKLDDVDGAFIQAHNAISIFFAFPVLKILVSNDNECALVEYEILVV